MINLINILFIMTVNARGNCQHGSIVKQSVGILSRNLSISLNTMKWKMFCNFENFFFVFFFFTISIIIIIQNDRGATF